MSVLEKVTLYKIKPGIAFGTFLNVEPDNCKHVVSGEFEAYTHFDYSGGPITEANISWLTFLNSGLTESIGKFQFTARNKYPRAFLAVKINATNNCYVATFGQHGDGFLNKDYIVRDFGIKVGMNICDREELKRVRTTIHEAITQQTERQASVGTRLSVFQLKSESEILRTISGAVSFEYKTLIDSFTGKENIILKFSKDRPLDWARLVGLCNQLEERYQSNDYKETEFASYDLFRHETDPQIIEQLDKTLCENIESGDLDKIHLAPPEFIDFDDTHFCYKEVKANDTLPKIYADLSIHDLISHPRRRLANLTEQTLRNWPVCVFDVETQRAHKKWNAYQCLVAEVTQNQKIYILSNSQWREVSDELKDRVDSYFLENVLTETADYLPEDVNIFDALTNENRESVYNRHVAANVNECFLFDQAKLSIAGDRKYEVCDLLFLHKKLVHVKRYCSGAASISHLFAQGRFYAHAFSTDHECRKDMRGWIDVNDRPENTSKDKGAFKNIVPEKNQEIAEGEYQIVFCVLHNKTTFVLDDLPFMSLYELMNSHKFLTQDRKFCCCIVFKKVALGIPEEAQIAQ